MAALLAQSDLVAEVSGTAGLVVGPGVVPGHPLSWTATVVRVLKGDAGLEGQAIQWFADILPGVRSLRGPPRALVFLKLNPEGEYDLTDRRRAFIQLSPTPPPGRPKAADPLEAIRAELLHCLQDDDWELASEAAARLAFFP
ncbi:MAG: hypothetical protein PVH68_19540, partial [Armatimonadota bacterium]